MEEQATPDLFQDNLQVDEKAKYHFAGITSWCIVIAIVALIGSILNFADLLMSNSTSRISSGNFSFSFNTERSPAGVIITVIINLVLNFFLYRFATQTQKAISSLDQNRLNEGLSSLKTYFIFFSILMIIFCLLMLLVIPAILNTI